MNASSSGSFAADLDRWLDDLFYTVPPAVWLILLVLAVWLFLIWRRRAASRDEEMRELIRQGKSSVSLSPKKRVKHPQMHGHYGEALKEPDDDAWKRRK